MEKIKINNNTDIDYFRKVLEEEKHNLEKELSFIAKKNPDGDWDPVKPLLDTQTSERGEVADAYEELENRLNTENELESRLKEVNAALEKIKNGTYGICEKTGELIDEKRLKANPTARTCVHSTKELK